MMQSNSVSDSVSGGKRLRSVSPPANATSFLRSVKMRAPAQGASFDNHIRTLQQFLAPEPTVPPAQELPTAAQEELLAAQAEAVDEFLDAELAAPVPVPAVAQIIEGNLQEKLQPLCDRIRELAREDRKLYIEAVMDGRNYDNQHAPQNITHKNADRIYKALRKVNIWEKNPTESTSLLDHFPYNKALLTPLQTLDVIARSIIFGLYGKVKLPDPKNAKFQARVEALKQRADLIPDPKSPRKLINKRIIHNREYRKSKKIA